MLTASRNGAVAVVVVAIMQTVSWAAGRPLGIGGSEVMNPLTAVALIGCGCALLCRSHRRRSALRFAGATLAAVTGLVVAVQLVAIVTGQTGPDSLLFHDRLDLVSPPSRMAGGTAVNLLLIGVSLTFLDWKTKAGLRPAEWTALLSAILLVLALVGFVFGTTRLYSWGREGPMALSSAIALLVLVGSVLAVRPDEGFVGFLRSDGPGGLAARRLLPIAIASPLAIGGLRLLGERSKLYSDDTGRSLVAVATIGIFTLVSWWVAQAIQRADTQRGAAERHLREALQMKSDFVAFVTHQLRTPLSGIKWMLELAHDGSNPEEVDSYVQDARESTDRLIALVNDLLDVSRLESGKLEVNPQPIDVSQVTRDVLSEVEMLVRNKGHRVTLSSSSRLPPGLADAQLLRQVVLNLVSNAIKYTPAGGQIALSIELEGGDVRWTIRDSGIGIPKAQQSRLFDKFYRADNALVVDTEGTGLGLYLARLIVERSGGRIGCVSDEGQGATFWFSIPATSQGVAA